MEIIFVFWRKVDDSSILADSSNRSSTIQSKTTLPPNMVSAKRKLSLTLAKNADPFVWGPICSQGFMIQPSQS
jgi:hypothetical protein